MGSIDLTIYLVDDIVSGPVCMLHIIYLDSNTLITIGCQPVKSLSIDNLAELCILAIWYEKVVQYFTQHCGLSSSIS